MSLISVFEDRRQVFAGVHLISGITLLLFVLLHWIEGCCLLLSSVEAVLIVVMLLTYWRIQQGADLDRVENILMASALLLFSALVFFESIDNTGIFWMAGFPFVAYFVQRVKKARYWVAGLVVELLIAATLQSSGWIETTYSVTQLLCIVAVILFFWVFAHVYQSQLEWRKQQLVESYRVLTQEQSRMQVILDHSPIGIWMLDENRNVQFMNKAWVKMCGIIEQKVQRGQPLPDVMLNSSDTNQLDVGQACYRRDEMKCRDGTLKIIDFIKVRLAKEDGSEAGVIGFAIDVTEKLAAEQEQKLLEKQIQHSQRLDSLGMMAGGVAHDFNNLLTVIHGSVELAKLESDLPEAVLESLSCIETASHTATDLCRQMLDYSGKGVRRVEPLNIAALIEEMLPLLNASKATHVRLFFDGDQKPSWILADKGQLRQVLLNLVINASEAIDAEEIGEIYISIAHREIEKTPVKHFCDVDLKQGRYVVMTVKDNGQGMDSMVIEHMFDPFFTTKFTGRGLGMSAIMGILRGHDAAMEIDSEPGVGTTMSVWLPEIEQALYADVSRAGEVKRQISGRVLLVDDDPGVIQVARRMLERLGLKVETAMSGREAVALFEKDANFDWVLLDVTMPEMDGGECLQKLRAIRSNVYVAMSSGFDADRVLSPENACQPNAFLTKPFTLKHLRTIVSDAAE